MSEPGQLLLEVSLDGSGQWRPVVILTLAQQPGSISNNTADGRDVIMFRCCGAYSLIERSLGGTDFEDGGDRIIATEGTETLAALHEGDSYEMPVATHSGRKCTARWTHLPA